ncbi:MAG: hypothetical protein AB9842_08095 [Bacteroidales bacterium]
MKKILLMIVVACFIVGCSTSTFIPKKEQVLLMDYRKYLEKGFVFSPEEYRGNCDILGTINYTIDCSVQYRSQAVVNPNYNQGAGGERYYIEISDWWINPLYSEDVLDSLYNKSVRLGADALVSLSYKGVPKLVSNRDIKNQVYTMSYEFIGHAIKRK